MGVPRVSLRGLVAVVFVLAHAGRLAGSEALESASLASAAGPAPSRPPSAAALAELKRLLAVHGAADEAALYQKAVELANGGANGGPALERGRRAAHALLRPLAEVGHTPAMARVARSHLLAEYGARDVPAAVELLRRAADAGEPDAQQQLGLLHSLGLGVEPDAALAVTLYYFAAEGGSTAAQLALAYRHLHGVGVPRDCGRALMYYSPVAERVVAAAQRSGGRGPLLEKTRLTDTSARAGRKALADDDDLVTYYQYSAERGSADAQLALAQLYFHGARGLPQDVALALSYYRQAAEGGEAAAHAHIGHMYVQGIGVAQDNATALHHFRSGAARQHPAALNGLGFMYLHGYGVEASAAKALENFRAAAEKGNPEAQFNLGAMHVSGQGGVRRAYDRALHFFSLAAHQGHTLALFNLGQMHRHGLGAPRSCAVAAHFLKAVSERGDWGADLERALRAYAQRADAMGAALLYAPLAEGGYEVAQANLATVADAAVRRGSARAELPALASAPALALEMLGRAAQQGNVDAQLRIGDYHFYGLGTKARASGGLRACPSPRCARVSARAHPRPGAHRALINPPGRPRAASARAGALFDVCLVFPPPSRLLRAGGPRAGGRALPHGVGGAVGAGPLQPGLHARARPRPAARPPPRQAPLRSRARIGGGRVRAGQGATVFPEGRRRF
jgi:SEL1 protein